MALLVLLLAPQASAKNKKSSCCPTFCRRLRFFNHEFIYRAIRWPYVPKVELFLENFEPDLLCMQPEGRTSVGVIAVNAFPAHRFKSIGVQMASSLAAAHVCSSVIAPNIGKP